MDGQERTIVRLWRDAVASGRPDPLYLAERNGDWTPVPIGEAARRVDELANGLLALGVRKGNAFGILAGTRVEWCLFDFALALVGGVTAPIYANSSPEDCRYVLAHSDAVGVLVEDEEQLAKVHGVRDELPGVEHVLTFADLDRLAERGRAFAAEQPGALAEAESRIGDDDLFTFIFTSGTTGPPKACKILHRNYYEMARAVHESADIREHDLLLLYLPLAHNFGRLTHLLAPMARYTIAFCADPYAVADALLKVKPTLFPSVPRVYEKIHTAVVSGLDDAHGLRRTIAGWALAVGREVSRRRQAGEPIPRLLALRHRIADRLVYSKVKERLGGRLRLASSGGAPLSR
jgi:long-chain acyl-CoA synthetase